MGNYIKKVYSSEQVMAQPMVSSSSWEINKYRNAYFRYVKKLWDDLEKRHSTSSEQVKN